MIIVLLFGANRLPKLARSSGQAIGEFSRGRAEIESELASVPNDMKTDEKRADSASETEPTSLTD